MWMVKGWTCDDILYGFDYKKVKPLEENYLKLKKEFGERHPKTKEAEDLLDKELVGLKLFIKPSINQFQTILKNNFLMLIYSMVNLTE